MSVEEKGEENKQEADEIMTRTWNLKKNKDEGNTETEGEGGSRFLQ